MQTNIKIIFEDIFYCFKLYIAFLGVCVYFEDCNKEYIIKVLSKPVSILIYISAICAILNQFIDIGMSSGTTLQFSIKTYAFIFSGNGEPIPGIYSVYSYMYLTIITIRLKHCYNSLKLRRHYIVQIILCLFGLVCTLQSRAFIFALTYCVLYYLLIVKNKNLSMIGKSIKSLIKGRYIVLLLIAIVYIGKYKFTYFFIKGTNRARYVFWKYGLETMKMYFPLGSGFATFGTNTAFLHYSKLYELYGMNKIYGLAKNEGFLASDTYWPAIIAQFGVVGLIFMMFLIYNTFKIIIKKSKENQLSMLVAIMTCVISLFSSIATSTFFHFTTLALFYFTALNFDSVHNCETKMKK